MCLVFTYNNTMYHLGFFLSPTRCDIGTDFILLNQLHLTQSQQQTLFFEIKLKPVLMFDYEGAVKQVNTMDSGKCTRKCCSIII